MVQFRHNAAFFAAFLAACPALAHLGHDLGSEIAARSAYLKHAPRDLSHCAEKLKARGHEQRALEKRAAKVQQLRAEVEAKKRKREAISARLMVSWY